MSDGYSDDKALREQAYRLTQAVFMKMRTRPVTPVEKVAPIVYLLLRQGTPVDHIELALQETKSMTQAGIDYVLATLVPRHTGMRPKMQPVEAEPWEPPSEEQKARAREQLALMRARLRGA